MPIPPLPPAPSPNATVHDVEEFFKDYFRASNNLLQEDQIQDLATKLRVTGQTLYLLPANAFSEAFGTWGYGLHQLLARGKYGDVSTSPPILYTLYSIDTNKAQSESIWPQIKLVAKCPLPLGGCVGLFQYAREAKDRNLGASIAVMCIVSVVMLWHQLSTTRLFLECKWYPRCLKLPTPAAAAATNPWVPW